MFSFFSSPTLRRTGLLLVSVAILGLSACKKDDDEIPPTPTSQTVALEFEHYGADSQPLVYGRTYTTALGAPYRVDSLKYYVTNVSFTRADGSVWQAPEAYYLVRATSAPADDAVLGIPAVPLGTYSKVTFSIGVDSARNHLLDQSGVLAPRYDMFWGWNTGYRFLRLDGLYLPAGDTARSLTYHLGRDPLYRTMTVTLDFPQNATVTAAIAPEAHIAVAVDKLFSGPNRMDLSIPDQRVVMGPAFSPQVAANVATAMFSVEHVHNDPQ